MNDSEAQLLGPAPCESFGSWKGTDSRDPLVATLCTHAHRALEQHRARAPEK